MAVRSKRFAASSPQSLIVTNIVALLVSLGFSTHEALPDSLPAREGPDGITCRDGVDNDLDGLVDLGDPQCGSAQLTVSCALMPVELMEGTSGRYEVAFESQGGSANVELTGDVLTVDETGVVLESLPIDNGGTVFLGELVPLKPEDGTRLAILRVKADDGSVAREAFCSPVPFLKMYEPQGRVVSESRGAVTKVMTAIPGMDVGNLSVEIDGLDVLAAMNLNPQKDFPGGPYDGSVQVRDRLVAVSDLHVGGAAVDDLRDFAALQRCFTGTGPGAPSIQTGCMDHDLGGDGSVGLSDFEALFESFTGPTLSLDGLRSNTLSMRLSNLGAGAHIIRVDATPALSSLPTPVIDGVGTLSVFGIHVDSPAEGEILDTVPTPVSGEVRHGRPIAGLTVNGVELDVGSQVLVPGDGVVAGDEYVLAFETAIEQTDMAADFANSTDDTGTFDPGSNRLIVGATDDLDNQTFLTRLFAVGPVASPVLPTVASGSDGPAGTVGESEIVNAFVLGVDNETLSDALQDRCDELTPMLNETIRAALNEFKAVEHKLGPFEDFPTHCDPIVTFGLNAQRTQIGSLNCRAVFEPALLTLRVAPQIRGLQVAARGECDVCVSVGDEELEATAVAVDVDLLLDVPDFGLSLRDWQNELPIDPERACEGGDQNGQSCASNADCCSNKGCCLGGTQCSHDGSVLCASDADCRPDGACEPNCGGDSAECLPCDGAGECVPHQSHIRFLEDSLTTPTIERVLLALATIRDFLDSSIAQTINDAVVTFIGGPGFLGPIDGAANQSELVVEDLRRWVAVRAAKFVPILSNPAGTAIALESFTTTPEDGTISLKVRFTPDLIDPAVQESPGAQLTPATAPRPADFDALNLFSVVADDVFDQILATLTLLGDFRQQCLPSFLVVGDFFPGCANGGLVPSPGFCTGLRGSDCEALVHPADQGTCHGVRGDDCTKIPVSPLDLAGVERTECRNTPLRNIHQDMPILQCGRVDVPPSFWIRDDFDPEGNPIATPDRIESHVRVNDVLFANVVDRQGDGADGPLPTFPDCSDGDVDPVGDCMLMGACLDLDIATAMFVETQGDESKIGLAVEGMQRLDRPAGIICQGGVDFGHKAVTQSTFETMIDRLLDQANSAITGLELGVPIPLANPRLIALRTSEARPGFDDYLGLTSQSGGSLLCGNGTCDKTESCGYSTPESCLRDCSLCPPGHACKNDRDCDTDVCVAGQCVEVTVEFAPGDCNDACLFSRNCLTGLCNLGFCTALYSEPAFSPCSTGRACRSRSCLNGLCEAVCGDGYCDGEEVCGNEDSTFECHTDCGRCPAGHPCLEDDTCRSGNCRAGFCESVCGDGFCDGTEICGDETSTFECRPDCGLCQNGDACLEDENCQSGICVAGFCASCRPLGSICSESADCCDTNVCNLLECTERNSLAALSPCTNDDACRSKNCVAGVCESICGDGLCETPSENCGADNSGLECRTDCGRCPNGTPCTEDGDCTSGNCYLGTCRSCKSNGKTCANNAQCCSTNCYLGTCRRCRSRRESCVNDAQCCSDDCGGFPRECR